MMTQSQIIEWHSALRHFLATNRFWGLGYGMLVTPPANPLEPLALKVHAHLFRAGCFNPSSLPANDA